MPTKQPSIIWVNNSCEHTKNNNMRKTKLINCKNKNALIEVQTFQNVYLTNMFVQLVWKSVGFCTKPRCIWVWNLVRICQSIHDLCIIFHLAVPKDVKMKADAICNENFFKMPPFPFHSIILLLSSHSNKHCRGLTYTALMSLEQRYPCHHGIHIDGLMQERRNSSALAMELLFLALSHWYVNAYRKLHTRQL